MKQTSVYWIRLPEHDNILEQGYVGISDNVEKRWEVHKRSAENPHLKNAVTKYGWDNLVKEVILVSYREYCAYIEEKFRPKNGIGWNINKGGDFPPIHIGEKHHNYGRGDEMSAEKAQFFKAPIVATNLATGQKTIYYGNKQLEAAGFQQPNVSKCVRGKRKSHKGHAFVQLSAQNKNK